MERKVKFIPAAPIGQRHRISSNAVWPLRRADGRTWAESKEGKGADPR